MPAGKWRRHPLSKLVFSRIDKFFSPPPLSLSPESLRGIPIWCHPGILSFVSLPHTKPRENRIFQLFVISRITKPFSHFNFFWIFHEAVWRFTWKGKCEFYLWNSVVYNDEKITDYRNVSGGIHHFILSKCLNFFRIYLNNGTRKFIVDHSWFWLYKSSQSCIYMCHVKPSTFSPVTRKKRHLDNSWWRLDNSWYY